MRLLLDTHACVWWHDKNPRLPQRVREQVLQTAEVFVSYASLWEITLKMSAGRFETTRVKNPRDLLEGFKLLNFDFAHLERIMKLPWIHRDPFDRMLIAQAQAEDLHLISHDRCMSRYDVKLIEA